jgi:hypothetical protein
MPDRAYMFPVSLSKASGWTVFTPTLPPSSQTPGKTLSLPVAYHEAFFDTHFSSFRVMNRCLNYPHDFCPRATDVQGKLD